MFVIATWYTLKRSTIFIVILLHKSENNYFCREFLNGLSKALKHIYADIIICINKAEIFAVDYFHSFISCIACTTVFCKMQNLNSAVFFSIFITDGTAIVRGTVINKPKFKIRKSLTKHRLYAHPKIFFTFIYGHNYTDKRLLHILHLLTNRIILHRF